MKRCLYLIPIMLTSVIMLFVSCGKIPEETEIRAVTEQTTSVTSVATTQTATEKTTQTTQSTTTKTTETTSQPITEKFVFYSDFGAVGDGETDDFTAIQKAHDYANSEGLKVKADAGAKYYIGKSSLKNEIIIKTSTDWSNAEFIIDDSFIPNNASIFKKSVFRVSSYKNEIHILGIKSFSKSQTSINRTFQGKYLVQINNFDEKIYIRKGPDQTDGDAKNDIFIVDENGVIDTSTPPIWDFDRITSVVAYPIDETKLTLTGGIFTTISNTEISENFYLRNIIVNRSNVEIIGLTHLTTGDSKQIARYRGFITASYCANLTVSDCVLTPRYHGYDIYSDHGVNISLIGCSQTISIYNTDFWGIFASNYSRNLLFDNCTLTRFDAHTGVYNATIRNCTLGHQGINAIGFGTLTVENTSVASRRFINFRTDYGATWRGDVIIKNCTYRPNGDSGAYSTTCIFGCSNDEHYDFGYDCTLPKTIYIENLTVDDTVHTSAYKGVYLFGNYNPNKSSKSFIPVYAYTETESITIIGFKSLAEMKWRLCPNAYLFQNAIITEE